MFLHGAALWHGDEPLGLESETRSPFDPEVVLSIMLPSRVGRLLGVNPSALVMQTDITVWNNVNAYPRSGALPFMKWCLIHRIYN